MSNPYELKCERCGAVYDARNQPPKQPCPLCEGHLVFTADKKEKL